MEGQVVGGLEASHCPAQRTWSNCVPFWVPWGVNSTFTFFGSSFGSPILGGGIFHWHLRGVWMTFLVWTLCCSWCETFPRMSFTALMMDCEPPDTSTAMPVAPAVA